jgi:hypothetical protein
MISVALALGLFCAGLYVLYLEIFEGRIIRKPMVMMGAFLTLMGAVWLWADVFSPLLKRKKSI